MFVCIHVGRYVHKCVHAPGEVRGLYWVSLKIALYLIFETSSFTIKSKLKIMTFVPQLPQWMIDELYHIQQKIVSERLMDTE